MLSSLGACSLTINLIRAAHGLKKQPNVTPDTVHAWETAAHYAVRPFLVPPPAIQPVFPPLTNECMFTRRAWTHNQPSPPSIALSVGVSGRLSWTVSRLQG